MTTSRHRREAGTVNDYPIRQESARGKPPEPWDAARTCRNCQASFRALAPGRTGERGIWAGWHWYCSQECADEAGVS